MIPGLPTATPLHHSTRLASVPEAVSAILKSTGVTRRRLKKLDAIAQIQQQRNDFKRKKRSAPARSCSVAHPSADPISILWNTPDRMANSGSASSAILNTAGRSVRTGYCLSGSPPLRSSKRREIYFRSAATILEAFGMPKGGRYYKRLIASFERIFYSTFFLTSDQQVGEATLMERRIFRFVKDAKLWNTQPGASESAARSAARVENVTLLSEEFWSEIQEHPIPVDLVIVKALADSPGNLDLYVWLVWRCWTAKGAATVPLFGHEGLISQLGNSAKLRERDFRRQIVQWLKIIRQVWPDCPATLAESGTCLILMRAIPRTKFSTARSEFDYAST